MSYELKVDSDIEVMKDGKRLMKFDWSGVNRLEVIELAKKVVNDLNVVVKGVIKGKRRRKKNG